MATDTQMQPGAVVKSDGKFFYIYESERTGTGSMSCLVARSRKDGHQTTRPRWMLFTERRMAATEIVIPGTSLPRMGVRP